MTATAAIVGAGPAGLMAAEVLAGAGIAVTLFEAKPSVGRKFLMAGKSGLNLTKDEPLAAFTAQYFEAQPHLAPMLAAFDSTAVQDWARGLGQTVFTGTSGRVFPHAMKASPLLRAWMRRLADLGVEVRTRMRWTGWDGDALSFENAETVKTDITILALGGASWARLGSDGGWADLLKAKGIPITPFGGANVGLAVDWSAPLQRHFGRPIKGVAWHAGDLTSRGEAILSARGLEGGGIYAVSRAVRQGHDLTVDLVPDLSVDAAAVRLGKPRGKASLSNHLRKALRLDPVQIALAQEWARPLPNDPHALARVLKNLPVKHGGLRPMDEAISTSGGVPFGALDADLMLRDLPGVFCAGEMLDWEAPTGGYLITGCLASGRWAAQGVLRRLGL